MLIKNYYMIDFDTFNTVLEVIIDSFAVSVGVIIVLVGCFYLLSFISWPFILMYCKYRINGLKEEIEKCESDNNSSVKKKLKLRIRYIDYSIMLNALKPNHWCHYYVKPISMDDIGNGKYALFLRGFERDQYNNDIKTLANRDFTSFSEYHFTKYINRYLPVYAVGMTNEIEPAIGSRRIYLSEETWQSDVLRLMDQAFLIIILINNKKNCIWEIEQSLKFLSKTLYIVDDIDKYREVASFINSQGQQTNGVPVFDVNWSFCYLIRNNEIVLNPLSHNIDCYRKIVSYYTETVFQQKRSSFFKDNKKEIMIVVIIFLTIFITEVVLPLINE